MRSPSNESWKMMKPYRAGIAVTALCLSFSSFTSAAHAADDENGVINDALAVVGQAPLTTTAAGPEVTSAGVTIEGDDSAVARNTSAGAQVIDVLYDGETSTSFSVDAPEGYQLEQVGDVVGIVRHVVEGEGDNATESLLIHGTFEEPWAVDANGEELPTNYEVVGDTLVQTVDTAGAEYPIVADPTLKKGDFKFEWSIWSPWSVEMEANKRGSNVIANGGLPVACAAIVFLPVAGPALAAVCAADIGLANIALSYNYCLKANFNAVLRRSSNGAYKGGFCK